MAADRLPSDDALCSLQTIVKLPLRISKLAEAVPLDVVEEENRHATVSFYQALGAGDARRVHSLLASTDLEWRFHGPACDQHLMQFLTGAIGKQSFSFTPVSVRPFGCNVFVEGEGKGKRGMAQEKKFWVHVWTMKHGKITQLREYFNTSLTVLKPSSSPRYAPHDPPLWQSQLGKKSSPSLILAM